MLYQEQHEIEGNDSEAFPSDGQTCSKNCTQQPFKTQRAQVPEK